MERLQRFSTFFAFRPDSERWKQWSVIVRRNDATPGMI